MLCVRFTDCFERAHPACSWLADQWFGAHSMLHCTMPARMRMILIPHRCSRFIPFGHEQLTPISENHESL
jgi:hypothetical protein